VAARIARLLWITWAVLLWNVLLDHTIESAARRYIVAAKHAVYSSPVAHHYENMDAWMRPAVTRGLCYATAGAGLVLGTGLILLRSAQVRTMVR